MHIKRTGTIEQQTDRTLLMCHSYAENKRLYYTERLQRLNLLHFDTEDIAET